MNKPPSDLTVTPAANDKVYTAAKDLLAILGTLLIVKYALLRVDALWTYAGPISLLASGAVATWRLGKSNESWADLGLARPTGWKKLLAWTVAVFLVTTVAGILLEGIASSLLTGPSGEPAARYASRFANVPGNTPQYLFWLAVAWIIGGFAEEMLFRGFLITRFERLFSRFPFAVVIAVLLQAILFGQQHYYYQGLSGALATGAIALVSGGFYLLLKRNLWPLTLSHGLANTIGLTLIYTGIQPAG